MHTIADVIGKLIIHTAGLDADLRRQTGEFVSYSLFIDDAPLQWNDFNGTRETTTVYD